MELKTFFKSKEGSKGQLICFPYLGGYVNSFNEIVRAMPEDVEIWVANPPGHFGSQLELISDIHELISLYYQEISKIIRPGSVFLGHSMGGVVSYFCWKECFKTRKKFFQKH